MNYRHAYHAGNFADVVKHAILVWIIRYLQLKPTPIRVIDSHAGVGRYDLTADEARRTGEWRSGIGRLLGPEAAQLPPVLAAFMQPYLAIVRDLQPAPDQLPTVYPGSPLLAHALLRPSDHLQVNEPHPDDQKALRRCFARDAQTTVMARDGWEVLRAVLPPPERRGVVLIDPPFEAADEFDRLAGGIEAALVRFRTGVTIVWYPVKDGARVAGCLPAPALRAELDVGASVSPNTDTLRLGRCGVFVVNPPFGLEPHLIDVLPLLARHLAVGPGAGAAVSIVMPRERR